MLYILPRVVLQVEASLYYKTIKNKMGQKNPLSFNFPMLLGQEVTPGLDPSVTSQPHTVVAALPHRTHATRGSSYLGLY